MSESHRQMTLADLRADGMRSVSLDCSCGHTAYVDVSDLPDGIGVPEVRRRYRCSKCGGRPWRSMPAWHERKNVPGMP